MTALEVLKELMSRSLVNEDGEKIEISPMPSMSEAEIEAFAQTLPCPLPDEIRELLRFTRGLDGDDGPFETVWFSGEEEGMGYEELFFHPITIAPDGFGNYWVVDLTPNSREWGPVYFVCHDAPVLLYQSANLTEFLREIGPMCTPPHQSLIDDVHEDRIREVWSTNPDTILQPLAAASEDPALRDFAQTLEPGWLLVDLRNAKPGDGFSWGRYGPRTEVRRAGPLPIFAYRKRKRTGLLARLLGE